MLCLKSKVLRSLIHEKLPLEFRIEVYKLCLRRDIINREKQEELIKLLRKYGVDNVVQLGSGTNRYALKIDGFVVKFATDHDGIIDNLKEFKMAKRLYPYVIKVWEVSENGTMLVCEYVQPFDSYYEMTRHQDTIREMLQHMSTVYLIGDVGISERNYSNWGTRVGSDTPVCLDFAYVYSVSSSIFICNFCKTNSMLVPDKNFYSLFCSNNKCHKEVKFEDIRSKIGNDIHKHEIGDLSEEGYLLDRSDVFVELDTSRSNYLLKES